MEELYKTAGTEWRSTQDSGEGIAQTLADSPQQRALDRWVGVLQRHTVGWS